jgi:hypothetical protein
MGQKSTLVSYRKHTYTTAIPRVYYTSNAGGFSVIIPLGRPGVDTGTTLLFRWHMLNVMPGSRRSLVASESAGMHHRTLEASRAQL